MADTKEKLTAKILLVDDDRSLLEVLRYNLERDGYHCLSSTSGAQAVNVAREEEPDLILLDVMLPELSGLEVCRILRHSSHVPIIMLSAKTDEIDKVVGLELGADDYITKPFSMRELQARIRSLLKRSIGPDYSKEGEPEAVIKAGDLQVYPEKFRATLKGKPLNLTRREFELLNLFASNKGLVLKRDQMLDKIWGYDYTGGNRTLDTLVLGLRKKIEEDPSNPRRLVTVWGIGYKLVA